jgi:hypothetical protein
MNRGSTVREMEGIMEIRTLTGPAVAGERRGREEFSRSRLRREARREIVGIVMRETRRPVRHF